MRTIKLITRFYGGICIPNLIITFCWLAMLMHYGDNAFKLIGNMFWVKVISIGLIFYSSVIYKKKELYYYQNLGISKLQLGIATSAFDLLFWLILSIIFYK